MTLQLGQFKITRSGRPQAAFVIETIGKMPAGRKPVRFEWYAENRNMPFRPWSFGLDVTTSRADYPGTINSPTEQVLNVRLTEFSLSGRWSDKWNEPGYAIKTWRAFEDLAGLGVMVRCSYRSVYVDGLIKNAQFTYMHEAEIGYSFTFSPHHREPGQPLQSSPRTVLNASQLLDEIVTVRDTISEFHDNSPRFFISGTLWQDVDDVLSDLNSTIGLLANVITQRIILPETEPSSALKRLAAVFRLSRTHAESLEGLLEPVRPDTSLTYEGGIQILSFEVWAKGILSHAKRLIVYAERASREMLSRAEPNAIALYRPHADEHLMKISNEFYGTPFNWKRIATRNNLGSALTMTGEELLIIPEAVARR